MKRAEVQTVNSPEIVTAPDSDIKSWQDVLKFAADKVPKQEMLEAGWPNWLHAAALPPKASEPVRGRPVSKDIESGDSDNKRVFRNGSSFSRVSSEADDPNGLFDKHEMVTSMAKSKAKASTSASAKSSAKAKSSKASAKLKSKASAPKSANSNKSKAAPVKKDNAKKTDVKDTQAPPPSHAQLVSFRNQVKDFAVDTATVIKEAPKPLSRRALYRVVKRALGAIKSSIKSLEAAAATAAVLPVTTASLSSATGTVTIAGLAAS